MNNSKKYYILYKVKRDINDTIIDIEYLKEFTTLSDIVKDYHIHFNNIKGIINKDYSGELATFKDFTIIQE